MSAYDLDTRGLLCPLPVIRTQDRVEDLQAGDELRVHATDPGAINDISAWCRINGHELLQAGMEDGEVLVRLRVSPAAS